MLGVLPHLRSNPIRTFLDAADRYGDLVHLKAGPYHGFLLCEPAHIKHVLQDNARNYHKSPLYDRLRDGIGNGLLTSEDSLWLRQRRLAQPAFHRPRVIAMADAMVACTEQMLQRWDRTAPPGEPIDLVAEMMALTQAIMRALEPMVRRHPEQWYMFRSLWVADRTRRLRILELRTIHEGF